MSAPAAVWAGPVPDSTAAAALIEMSAQLYRRGWMEGTAGNLSLRLSPGGDRALITPSGLSKGELSAADCVPVQTRTGRPIRADGPWADGPRASAETVIHAAIYRSVPNCGAVIHVHPPHATALATARAELTTAGSAVRFRDLEFIKGLTGPGQTALDVPVFANYSDVGQIGQDVANRIAPGSPPVLLIAGHGATAWGRTLAQARDRLECLEALSRLTFLTASLSPPPPTHPFPPTSRKADR